MSQPCLFPETSALGESLVLSSLGRGRCRGEGGGQTLGLAFLRSISETRLVLLIDRYGDQLFRKLSPPWIGVGVSANSPNTRQTGLLEEVPGMLAEQTRR